MGFHLGAHGIDLGLPSARQAFAKGLSMNSETLINHPSRLIMKFGGTSVGTPDALAQVVKIVQTERQNWKQIVVVISAFSGVTDLLLNTASQMVTGKSEHLPTVIDELTRRHHTVAESLIKNPVELAAVKQDVDTVITGLASLYRAIAILGEATPRALDAVAATGERLSVRVLSAAIRTAGIPSEYIEATRLIRSDNHFQDAHPDFNETRRLVAQELIPVLEQGKIPVVTGFIAATVDGITTTLGRGGSDYSAALLGAALPADDVWIFTDVDGVMTADPRLVPDAFTVPVCSYREISELAYYGAKVLHPKTIRPVIEAGIGLRVCNTFNPSHPGTRLVAEIESGKNGVIKAITLVRDLKLITLEGRGMLGVPGVAARTFDAVACANTSVPLITQASSEQSICFAVPSEAAEIVIEMLNRAFAHELERRDIDRIWATESVSIITVVGAGMKSTPGVAGRVFSLLGSARVNVIAIAQGSSEVSISLVVNGSEDRRALLELHRLVTQPAPPSA